MRYVRWALMAGTFTASVACGVAETVEDTTRYGLVAVILAFAVIAVTHLELDS